MASPCWLQRFHLRWHHPFVRWHAYGEREGDPPRLTQGWRAEACGDLLTDVLNGKITLRVADPQSDHPLVFERRGE